MTLDYGLFVLRLAVGLIVAAHGVQKLFGWFNGPGLAGTAKMMGNLRLEPSRFWAWISALNESVGGLLTALGLLMPIGPLLIIANMLTATAFVHWHKGFWNTNGGWEYPLTLAAAALSLVLTGTGIYALDPLLGIALPEPLTAVLGLIVVLIGFGLTLGISGRIPLGGRQPTPRTQ